jgi:hypothetical protein
MSDDCSISFRMDRRLRRLIEQAADEEGRTVSGLMRRIFLQWNETRSQRDRARRKAGPAPQENTLAA